MVGWSPTSNFQPKRVDPAGPLSFGFPYESKAGGWFGGPTIAVRVQPRFYLSLDALVKPLEYEFLISGLDGAHVQRSATQIYSVQFPVLARYHFTDGPVQPFVEGGPSFRVGDRSSIVHSSGYGFTAGAGLRFLTRGVALMPRVRYTRWASDPSDALIRTKQDQVEILLGVTSHGDEDTKPLGKRVSLGATVGSYLGDQTRSTSIEIANPFGPGTVTNRTDFEPRRFLFGPVMQVGVTSRISLEVNALIRSYRTTRTLTFHENGGSVAQSDTRRLGPYARWEVPVLVRYQFGDGKVQPFVLGGASVRKAERHSAARGARAGFTTGGGMELPWKAMRFAPQVRYTRWGEGPALAQGYTQLPRNEVYLLFSTMF